MALYKLSGCEFIEVMTETAAKKPMKMAGTKKGRIGTLNGREKSQNGLANKSRTGSFNKFEHGCLNIVRLTYVLGGDWEKSDFESLIRLTIAAHSRLFFHNHGIFMALNPSHRLSLMVIFITFKS